MLWEALAAEIPALVRGIPLYRDAMPDGVLTHQVAGDGPDDGPDSGFDLSDAERAMVEAALRQHHHNVTQAAAALDLSRGALYRRMARYGL